MSHVVWSVGLCVLVTPMCPAETAKAIAMSFGILTRVGLRYHVSDKVDIPK